MRTISFPAPRRAVPFLLLAAMASPVLAQGVYQPGGTAPLAYGTPLPVNPLDPIEALSRYLRILAANPQDLAALTGAGHAALEVGDPAAALGFYARADALSPRNGRIKAGLGSALTQLEQPREALKLFEQAVALGVPAAEIASDRGLAHDLRGEQRNAQADYTLALRANDDPETVRRLALSMAISGDRSGAMAILGSQLRARDRAALRTRAFVLALTGDMPGAASAVQAAMPGAAGTAITPFLGQLAGLHDAQKAAAVHLGHFPASGRQYSEGELFADAASPAAPAYTATPLPAPATTPVRRADVPLIPTGTPPATSVPAAPSASFSRAPRRRPGASETAVVADSRQALPIITGPPPAAAPVAIAPAAGSATPTTFRPVPARAQMASAAQPRMPAPSAIRPTSPVLTQDRPPPPTPIPSANAPAPLPAPGFSSASVAAPVVAFRPSTVAPAEPQRMPPPPPVQPPPSETPSPARPAAQPVVAVAPAPASSPALLPPPLAPMRSAVLIGPPDEPDPTLAPVGRPAPVVPSVPPPVAAPAATAPAPAESRPVLHAVPTRPPAIPARGHDADTVAAKAGETGRSSQGATGRRAGDAAATRDRDGKRDQDGKRDRDATAQTGRNGRNPPAAARTPPKPVIPERYWVQVASGANKDNLDRAWDAVRAKASSLLRGRQTWTAPWRASNRLLVGPFPSEDAAQEFVNRLAGSGVSGIQFTSRAGVEVERLTLP